MTFPPMRPIKRLLLFAIEAGVLVLGFVFSLALSIALAIHFDSSEPYAGQRNSLGEAVLYSGWLLTIVGFVSLRRKTRPWKIEYDAVGWALDQNQRKLRPTRARCKRLARRTFVWVPSLIAAGVLFFLPVATHLIYPCSRYLRHYRVPIPWNFAVFSPHGPPAKYSYVLAIASSRGNGRLGVTPFWDSRQLTSEMHFGSIDPDAGTFELNQRYAASRRAGAAEELRREFRLGDVEFTCWQYVHPHRYQRVGPSSTEPLWWNIDCSTPVDVRQQNMYAWFLGRQEDISSFYTIIEGVKPRE